MLAHCRARRTANATVPQAPLATQESVPTSPRTNAMVARARILAHFNSLSTVRRSLSLPSASRSSSNTPTLATPTTVSRSIPLAPILPDLTAPISPVTTPPTEAEKAALEAEEQARDLQMVRNELNRYKEEPFFAESAQLDLVRYWDVRRTKCLLEYSTLSLRNRNRKLFTHFAIK